MFTGYYGVLRADFCNIYRENPVIFTDCREIPADIAEKPLNHPVNPYKHLQCETVFILSDLKIFFQRSYLTHYFLIKDNIMSLKKPES